MQHTILLLLIALLLCQPEKISAQSAEDWQTYLSVSKINGHLDLGDQTLLATDGGIAVYDKTTRQVTERWTRASHGLPSNMIEGITRVPGSQQLIIGTYDLGVFRQSSSEVGSWDPIPFPESVNTEQHRIYCVTHDDQDRLLVGSSTGLWIMGTDQQWINYGPGGTENFLHAVWDFARTDDGTVYAGGNLVYKISQGTEQLSAPVDLSGGLSDVSFDSLHFSYGDRKFQLAPNGDLWNMNDLGQIARLTAAGEWEIYGPPFNHEDLSFSVFDNFFLDTAGELHVQTFGGDYYRFQDSVFVPADLPAALTNLENIISLDGELIGRSSDSLFFYAPGDDVQLAGKMGDWPWPHRVDRMFNDRSDNTWARLHYDRVINLSEGEIVELPLTPSGTSYYQSFHFAGQDAWLQSSNVFYHWADRAELIEYPFAPGHESNSSWTRSSLVTADGTPWFTTDNKEIYTLIDGQWKRQMTIPDNHYISSLIPFPSNRVLVTILNLSGPNEAWLLGPDVAETYSFADDFNWENYWSPYPGEVPGSVWFYNHDDSQLVNYYQGNSTTLDLPTWWPESESIRSFQEINGHLLVATQDRVAIHHEGEWIVYNHENAPLETTPISSARLDAGGELRITHSSYRFALEQLATGLLSGTEEVSTPTNAPSLLVYPNPAGERIAFSSDKQENYRIYNAVGQLVSVGASRIGTTQIGVARLTPGVYYLRLGNRTASFVIER